MNCQLLYTAFSLSSSRHQIIHFQPQSDPWPISPTKCPPSMASLILCSCTMTILPRSVWGVQVSGVMCAGEWCDVCWWVVWGVRVGSVRCAVWVVWGVQGEWCEVCRVGGVRCAVWVVWGVQGDWWIGGPCFAWCGWSDWIQVCVDVCMDEWWVCVQLYY